MIGHPDWVKLSVELNLRAKLKYEISLPLQVIQGEDSLKQPFNAFIMLCLVSPDNSEVVEIHKRISKVLFVNKFVNSSLLTPNSIQVNWYKRLFACCHSCSIVVGNRLS